MGFDVVAKKRGVPSFSRNLAGWRGLWEWTCATGDLGEVLRRKGHYNDGAGLGDAAAACLLADALAADVAAGGVERWCAAPPCPPAGVDLAEDALCAALGAPRCAPTHGFTRADAEAWIEFLRRCGGFEIR